MARGNGEIAGGIGAAAFVALLCGGAGLGLVIAAADNPAGAANALDARLGRVIAFTLLQAGLSTLLSVGLALPLALALDRHRAFPGRAAILRLFALPMALPALVGALAILALFGRNGLLAQTAGFLGLPPPPDIYGLGGILIAHVFFNLPMAARMLLAAMSQVPPNHYRLAAQNGMDETAIFRVVAWPHLAAALPGISALIALLCLTSFTLVLLLGGGPAATTLEVEIYQSLRYDFDPARAAVLVAVQLVLAGSVALVAGSTGPNGEKAVAERRPARHLPAGVYTVDLVIMTLATLFIVLPLFAIVEAGLRADWPRLLSEASVWRSVFTSLSIGGAASFLAAIMALALAAARYGSANRFAAGLFDRSAFAVLAFPAAALATGWFLLVNRFADPALFSVGLVIAINAAMALPFAYRLMRPAHDAARARNDRLCAALGISGLNRWRLVDWPVQRVAILSALAFAAALSLGDFGVVALFGAGTVETLPWLLYARIGAYRTADADGLALLLALICLGLLLAGDRLARSVRS